MRMPFNRIFAEIEGRFIPQMHIGIGSVVIAAGVPVSPELEVAGFKISRLTNRDLAVEVVDGVVMIQGFYKDDEPEKSTGSFSRSA